MNAYLPARFTPTERLADAIRSALANADDRAFYVREDAAQVARYTANRYASVEALAMARRSLADHSAEYLDAVRHASELAERADECGFCLNPRKPVENAEAADELSRLAAIIAACTERGEPAPVLVLVAVRNLAAGVL